MIKMKWFLRILFVGVIANLGLMLKVKVLDKEPKIDTVYIPRPVFVFVHDTVYTSEADEFAYPTALTRAQQDSIHNMLNMAGVD